MAISPLFRPNASVCSLLYLQDDDGNQGDDDDLNDNYDDDLNHDDDYDDDNMLDISTSWLSGRLQSCHIEYFSGPELTMFEKNAKYLSYFKVSARWKYEKNIQFWAKSGTHLVWVWSVLDICSDLPIYNQRPLDKIHKHVEYPCDDGGINFK